MRYFLAHNKLDVFHYGNIQEDQVLTSGQPYIEYFNTLVELQERLISLGQEYTETNTVINLPSEEPSEEPSI
jgi:hypothetical protein